MAKNTLNVYFPKEKLGNIEKLRAIAERKERTLNYVVMKALEEYIEKEEG